MKAALEASFRATAQLQLPGLRRLAYAISASPYHGDDLVQGALERLYLAWPRAHEVADPGAYARTILIRLAIAESRRPWRRERSTSVLPETVTPDPGSAMEVRVDLQRALSSLTVKQRAVVVLRYLEDRPVADVAAALNISAGTVKRQSSDALERLRRALGPDFVGAAPVRSPQPRRPDPIPTRVTR